MTHIITDTAVLIAEISRQGKSAIRFEKYTHLLACSCVFIAARDANCTPAAKLLDELGRSFNRVTLTNWFEKRGIKIHFDSERCRYKAKLIGDTMRPLQALTQSELKDRLLATAHYEEARAQTSRWQGYRLKEKLAVVLKQAEAIKSGEGRYAEKSKHKENNFDGIDDLRKLIGAA